MNYQETIDYLFHATPVFEHIGASAYKPGLQTTVALDNHYGNPHHSYQTIHVAGTNGKGSCSHAIASVLQECGYKVGLYTSPHLRDFRERIRVNGTPVSKAFVVSFVEDYISWNNASATPLHPSFFELTTAMALKYFAEEKVDIAVIEVGLGGRLDCTNIITPILSVITNISFDHTQLLGSSLSAIATEKAGIIKRGVPVIVGETVDETRPVFQEKARSENAPLFWAEDMKDEEWIHLPFELKGDYQEHNRRTVSCALKRLDEAGIITWKTRKDDKVVADGLRNICRNTGLEGRWQTIRKEPLVICDTGHNVAGWQFLSRQIMRQPCKQLRMVFGMVDDKDLDTVLSLLPPKADYYFTQAQSKRAIPASEILSRAKLHGLHGRTFGSVEEAYAAALADAESLDFIFVGGSSYVVADFLTTLPL